MFSLFESHFARPRSPIIEASVTTNGWIRNVATSTPFQKSVHGETHFFCSEACKAKFTA